MTAEKLFFAAAARPEDLLARLGDTDRVLAGSSLLAVPETAPLRIAIADPTPERVELARRVVARGTPWRGRSDVWFSPSGLLAAGRGKIAFTFPGLESAPAPELELADVAAHFGIEAGRHGTGIIRVGRLLVAALHRLGVDPDVVGGYRLGEWTAMIVSETVPSEAADAVVDGLVAGDAPVHHWLRGLPLGAPRIQLWSSITARPFPADRDGIRELATRLLTEPVRFRELVGNLYDDGVRVFLQPGIGSVTGLVGDALGDRDHLTIAAADHERSGLAQLTRVAAALWVEGADIRFERLAAPTLLPRAKPAPLAADAGRDTTAAPAHLMQDALPDPTEVSSTHPVPQASVRAGAPVPPPGSW